MNNKKDNLIIEDFSTKFNYKKKQSNLIISFNRIAFIFFIFAVIFFTCSLKLFYLAGHDNSFQKNSITNSDFRSTILDRNGVILAKSVITRNIGINPPEIIDKEKLLINLKIIFPKKNFEKISKQIDSNKFFYLEKKISQKKYDQLFLLGVM